MVIGILKVAIVQHALNAKLKENPKVDSCHCFLHQQEEH